MIKKALLFSIVLLYTGVSLAEITLLSKARVFMLTKVKMLRHTVSKVMLWR